jgi:hypothetical protein
MLSKQALQDFKEIWKKERGEEISDERALVEAIALLTGFDAAYKPIKKEWIQNNGQQTKTI